jgi:hypothetical protein
MVPSIPRRPRLKKSPSSKRNQRPGDGGWEMMSYGSVPMFGAFSNKLKGYAYLLFLKRPKAREPRASSPHA